MEQFISFFYCLYGDCMDDLACAENECWSTGQVEKFMAEQLIGYLISKGVCGFTCVVAK